jgi:putative endonuclease
MAPLFERLKQWVSQRPVSTGEAGEKAAENFLKHEKDFRIRERNWRNGQDEIDLIALEGDILVFVEVKTRRSGGLVPGYYSVDKRKKRALKRASRAYLKTLKQKPITSRLDVVEVNYHPEKEWAILHFTNVEW